MSYRRVIPRAIVFVLLGAIINIAVAWACGHYSWSWRLSPTDYAISRWPRRAPLDFPPPHVVHDDRGRGFRQIVASRVANDSDITDLSGPIWIQSVNQSGFPFLSMEWLMHYSPAIVTRSGDWEVSGIPVPDWLKDKKDLSKRFGDRPVWLGFAINTAFYAAILRLIFTVPFALRRRRGLCRACAYPVGESRVCTECGKPLT